jgi:uncharacterized protein
MQIIDAIGQSLLTAAGMAWQVLWSLVLGFTISGMIQAYVSRARMSEALGRAGFKEIALATAFGAAILVYLNRKHPMMMSHEGHGEHNMSM